MSATDFTTEQIAIMDKIISRYPRSRSAVMPLLHYVQSIDGFVSPRGIEKIAEILELATAEVTAVSSFYTQYLTKPVGEYHVGVCINTLCAVMGGDAIYDSVSDLIFLLITWLVYEQRLHTQILSSIRVVRGRDSLQGMSPCWSALCASQASQQLHAEAQSS